jgi:drug/metabolite transporter (DMT)-like permease
MQYIIFAWIALIAFALETIGAKLIAKYGIKNPWLYNFLWELIILVFIIPLAYVNNAGFPVEWINVALASFFGTLVNIFFVLAIQRLDISTLSPLFNFRLPFSVILGALLLGEILTAEQYIYIGLIFACGVLVSLDEKFSLRSFFHMPIAYVLIMTLSLAFMSVYINKAIQTSGYWATSLWMQIIIQVMSLPTILLFKNEIKKVTGKQFTSVALLGCFTTAGILASNRAFQGNVSISTTIISLPLSMILAFLFSVFAPKLLEKHTLKIYAIRFSAAAVMIISALKLTS